MNLLHLAAVVFVHAGVVADTSRSRLVMAAGARREDAACGAAAAIPLNVSRAVAGRLTSSLMIRLTSASIVI